MGYDMYWVTTPPEVTDRRKAAEQVWRDALATRDAIPREECGDWANTSPEDRRALFERDGIDALPPDATPRYRVAQEAVIKASNDMYHAEANYFRLNIFGMPRYVDAMFRLGMVYDSYTSEGGMPEWPNPGDDVIGSIADELRENQDLFVGRRLAITDEPADAVLEKLCGVEAGQARWYDGNWPAGKWVAATPEEARLAIDYARRCDAHLAAHPEVVDQNNPSVIPMHKFGSNDGWHVTPDEITAALNKYQQHTGEQVVDALVAAGVIDGVVRADQPDNRLNYWDAWIEFLHGAVNNGGFKVF